MNRTEEIKRGCGKKVLNLNGVVMNYCGKLVREDNTLGTPDLCPTCQAKLEERELTLKEELEFLELSLLKLREVRKSIAGLSFLQVCFQDRILLIKQELEE
jgi:hypothetical protein